MDDDSPISLDRFREMVEMLRRTVEAGSESARRIDVLEKASREIFDVMVTMQDNQRKLLDSFEKQSNGQHKVNTDLINMVQRLTAEIEQLKGGASRGLIM